MIASVLLMSQLVSVPAAGLPQRVPATSFSCELTAADGSRVSVAGVTPEFARGTDPNAQVPMTLTGAGSDGLTGRAMVSPGDASDWFREFQISSLGRSNEVYRLNLMLRREGTSVAYTTRYVSSGQPIPYDYHAAGLCTANFAPGAGESAQK